jgi:hypothetical protein
VRLADWLTIGALSAAFSAGGYFMVLRYGMRDVNGLGRKYGKIVSLLIRWADTDEKRKQVADLLEGK